METLRAFINALEPGAQAAFAVRCGTTVNYLRNAISSRKKLGESICINVERESLGSVRCEDLRPDVDWDYLRGTVAVDPEKQAKTKAPSSAVECGAVDPRHGIDRRAAEKRQPLDRRSEGA